MVSAKAQHPVVSVVMPTYNHAVFIGEAIQSVLSQTFADFELIVVDNYSEDDTESVVRGFGDPRIEYIKFANNGVIAASRNAALNRASGEFIAFLDSDDTWSPDKIAVQLEYMRANPNVALICGSMVTRHGNEPFSAVARSSDAVISGYGYNRLLDCNFIFCSS
ncbi:MAG: glycosyltransferase family 2 protein, partial [bacterium]|nr:glycosyltransferase family 2 protein [bacterium]